MMGEGQVSKKNPTRGRVLKKSATTYSPTINAVPSALTGLTSLFGMGRGGPRRYSHLKILKIFKSIRIDISESEY